MSTVLDRLNKHSGAVSPGQPFRITNAHQPGEGVWQGDLGIEMVATGDDIANAKPPAGYVLVRNPTDVDRQLAVEAGAGSHHRLRSLDGVRLYRPKDWGLDEADLRGPFVVFESPNAVVHEPGHDKPHGTVFIDTPCAVQIRYQRNLDAETRREIRARD